MRQLERYAFSAASALSWMALIGWMNMGGCAAPAKKAVDAPAAVSPGSAAIQALIEKLAISDDEAASGLIFTPRVDTPKTDSRMIAYDAAEQLQKFGAEAFPLLLASLDDKRQSVAFRRVLPSTVGDACYCLITRQLYELPREYSRSIYRRGADGRQHERPIFGHDLFDTVDLRQWLAARKDRTLRQLQIEALGWVLSEEEQIGASTPDDEKSVLEPLRAQYRMLKGE
jgi:predicted DCC family thiol-disulfide oxidoreductase YuxK